jgi:hypothetical protein
VQHPLELFVDHFLDLAHHALGLILDALGHPSSWLNTRG